MFRFTASRSRFFVEFHTPHQPWTMIMDLWLPRSWLDQVMFDQHHRIIILYFNFFSFSNIIKHYYYYNTRCFVWRALRAAWWIHSGPSRPEKTIARLRNNITNKIRIRFCGSTKCQNVSSVSCVNGPDTYRRIGNVF